MHRLALALVAVLVLAPLPPLRAMPQEQETGARDETALLAEWDAFEAHVRDVERRLSALQAEFSGAREDAERARIETEFQRIRSETFAAARAFLERVDAFVAADPKNVAVRKRRLEDRVFDRLSQAVKARDAEALYEITGDGEYLHKAAEAWTKAYRPVEAVKLWERANERAKTFESLKSLGEAYMQTNDFARAKASFERAVEVAPNDAARREVGPLITTAAEYVNAWKIEQELRAKSDDLPLAEIVTERGTMTVELFEDQAPNTVANFIELAERGFYDGLDFHRAIAYFMIQGGDPQGNGQGGPGYRVRDEFARPDARLHYAGSLSMANTGQPDSNGSQFFVTNVVTGWLNHKHTVFGRVIDGLEVAQVRPIDATNKAEPFRIETIRITRKRDHPYVAEKLN